MAILNEFMRLFDDDKLPPPSGKPPTPGAQPQSAKQPAAKPVNDFDQLFQSKAPAEQQGEQVIPQNAEQQIKSDEGDKAKVYLDTKKLHTIGVGFNMDDAHAKDNFTTATGIPSTEFEAYRSGQKALTPEQDKALLSHSIGTAEADVRKAVPEYDQLPDEVRGALTNMSLNLGGPRFAGFHKMIGAINRGDFNTAADEILNSDAAKELPLRYKRIASTVRAAGN